MLIYKATIPTINKSYIGLIHKNRKTIQDRAHDHYLASQKLRRKRSLNIKIKNQNKFLNAILVYSFDTIKWQIIEDNIEDFDYLLQRQIYYIQLFNTYKDGLNSTIGGQGCKGLKQSQYRKQVARQLRLGKKQSEQTRKRKSEAQKDRKHTPQTIRLLRRRRKEYLRSQAGKIYLKKLSQRLKNQIVSQQTRKKQSQNRKRFIKENPQYVKQLAEKMTKARIQSRRIKREKKLLLQKSNIVNENIIKESFDKQLILK